MEDASFLGFEDCLRVVSLSCYLRAWIAYDKLFIYDKSLPCDKIWVYFAIFLPPFARLLQTLQDDARPLP